MSPLSHKFHLSFHLPNTTLNHQDPSSSSNLFTNVKNPILKIARLLLTSTVPYRTIIISISPSHPIQSRLVLFPSASFPIISSPYNPKPSIHPTSLLQNKKVQADKHTQLQSHTPRQGSPHPEVDVQRGPQGGIGTAHVSWLTMGK